MTPASPATTRSNKKRNCPTSEVTQTTPSSCPFAHSIPVGARELPKLNPSAYRQQDGSTYLIRRGQVPAVTPGVPRHGKQTETDALSPTILLLDYDVLNPSADVLEEPPETLLSMDGSTDKYIGDTDDAECSTERPLSIDGSGLEQIDHP